MEWRLENLSGSEEAVLRQYLGTLATLEQAIPGSGGGLDTRFGGRVGAEPGGDDGADPAVRRLAAAVRAFLGVPAGRRLTARREQRRAGGVMDGVELQDRFSRGMGAAARALGMPHDLFRPHGTDSRWRRSGG